MRRLAPGAGLMALAVLSLVAPYTLTPHYAFPAPEPFAGTRWLNPYAGAQGRWLKANFHAHAIAWGGLTAGRQTTGAVVARYRSLGYDIPGISNYQEITRTDEPDSSFIPIYEHGFNLWKRHQLVIDATRVEWLDFPLGQTLSDKQYVLDRLSRSGGLVAIAHPYLLGAYTRDDFRWLTDYPLMEVLRQGHAATARWDAALSSGHAVWILGDDDEHNLGNPNSLGVSWTMVRAPSNRRGDIVSALRAGHMYGVVGHHGSNDVLLRAVEVHGDTLTVTTDPGALTFRFVGQGGRPKRIVRASSQASYVLRSSDTYVRVEIRTPHTTLYLNPVVRSAGTRLVRPIATAEPWLKWAENTLRSPGLIWGQARVRTSAAVRSTTFGVAGVRSIAPAAGARGR